MEITNEENYWKRRVEHVAKISKKYNYLCDLEFWMKQPICVISLIIDIYASQTTPTNITEKECQTELVFDETEI